MSLMNNKKPRTEVRGKESSNGFSIGELRAGRNARPSWLKIRATFAPESGQA